MCIRDRSLTTYKTESGERIMQDLGHYANGYLIPIVILVVAVCFVLAFKFIASRYKKFPPNVAGIFYGRKYKVKFGDRVEERLSLIHISGCVKNRVRGVFRLKDCPMSEVEAKPLPRNAYLPLKPGESYIPIVPAKTRLPELTLRSIFWGVVFCVVFSVASAYSALKLSLIHISAARCSTATS